MPVGVYIEFDKGGGRPAEVHQPQSKVDTQKPKWSMEDLVAKVIANKDNLPDRELIFELQRLKREGILLDAILNKIESVPNKDVSSSGGGKGWFRDMVKRVWAQS